MNESKILKSVLPVLWLLAAPTGCYEEDEKRTVDLYTCENPDPGHKDKNGNPDPCHRNDAKPASCGEACKDLGLAYEAVPVALWFGTDDAAPACPGALPIVDFNGGAGIIAEDVCPVCTCGEPTCEMPDAVVGLGSDACASPVTGKTDPPPTWDGACFPATGLEFGTFASLALEPTAVSGCVAGDPPPKKAPGVAFPARWETSARACRYPDDAGCQTTEGCEVAPNDLTNNYRSCLRIEGASPDDAACPADFPERFVFYADTKDTRDCTPCECTPPSASACVASLALHAQDACADVPFLMAPVNEVPGACWDPQMPQEVKSISATWTKNNPGACTPSGGEPTGDVAPIQPAVFCCQALPAD